MLFPSRTNTALFALFRGATLDSQIACALGGIPSYPRQLTYAHTSQNTLRGESPCAFDCALGGPFDDLFPA